MDYTKDNERQDGENIKKSDRRYQQFMKEQQEFSKLKKSDTQSDVLHKVEHPEILNL